jgi:regulator of sigma E protease
VTTFLINAVIYLIAISILVAVHEFGHFWMARRVGVKVLRFSIGFGRVLWSRPLKDGTEFAISAIPVGGYVSMLGERDDNVSAADAHRAFKSQPPSKRIAVMAAGPLANFLFAFLIYWALFMVSSPGLKPVVGEVVPNSIAAAAGLRTDDQILAVDGKDTATREAVMIGTLKGLLADGRVDFRVVDRNSNPRDVRLNAADRVRELTEQDPLSGLGFNFWYPPVPAKLGAVEAGSPAEQAGLKVGDEILRFDGEAAHDFGSLRKVIQSRADRDVEVEVERDGSSVNLQMRVGSIVENGKRVGRIGIGPARVAMPMPQEMILPRDSVFGALQRAVAQTWDKTVFVFQTVGYLITGKVSFHSVSGPVGIAAVAGEAARIGLLPFIGLLALISISIGALNLLPIPVLDGGQIVFQLAELLKGRPVSERAQVLGQQVGIALLILLTVLAFFNDITRLS